MDGDRPLREEEIIRLERQGCVAGDWGGVSVGEGFDPSRVSGARLIGRVRLGALRGSVRAEGGIELPAEIRDATLADCRVGDDVRIHRVGGHIARYRIEDGAVIDHVGTLAARPGATFGAGAELLAVNEAGGRQVRLFGGMSSQFAYLLCMHRGRPALTAAMNRMIDAEVAAARAETGVIGRGARVVGVSDMVDVAVGPGAEIVGADSLRNGTILSEEGSPARVGASVVAKDFVIGEGSSVESGAILDRVFVGQGVQIGRGFSAQDSLFFANCEMFHGEACSIFAGPFTVSHHKNTLLIAGIFSFYNAGSGTNFSNHMYKLGPVHQGGLLRGSKSGSFAYLKLPSVVAPFSMVVGRHGAPFDAGEFPFSYVLAENEESILVPAVNLFRIGTMRDGEKWPRRDRRTAAVPRDRIVYETVSPYTVGLMMRGERALGELYERGGETVRYKGLTIKRAALRAGAKTYAAAIDAWLARKVSEGFVVSLSGGIGEPGPPGAWADVSGLLMSRARLEMIERQIELGAVGSIEAFEAAMAEAAAEYRNDESAWARRAYGARSGRPVDALSAADAARLRDEAMAWEHGAYQKALGDAEKEFGEAARYGYGLDEDDSRADFEAVRGTFEGNRFLNEIRERLGGVNQDRHEHDAA
ncbi:MAG: DUF4954 family protein [Candidatus Sumerlaeia bacterium]